MGLAAVAEGGGLAAGVGACTTGRVAQPASSTLPTMAAHTHRMPCMLLLLLEALGAGLLFIAIIWWTMFAGRPKGELPPHDASGDHAPDATASAPKTDSPVPGPES